MLIPEMSGRASSPVLVGRAEPMAALEAAFVSVRQGGPSAVLLGGESMTVRMLIGGALVLTAMLVVEIGPRKGTEGEVPHLAV